MNYMLIDTAEGTRVLLSAGGKIYYRQNMASAGAQTLMPVIDELLGEAGIKAGDVDCFGACIGPGSFTGLRVGLATVKTLCYALGKKSFAVNNLELYSYNNSSGRVISVAYAGSNVCYIAAFDGETTVYGPACVTFGDAERYIAEHPDYAVSTDLKLAGKIRGTSGVGEAELAAAAQKALGSQIDAKELLPLYIRKAQPERGEGDL